MTWSEDRATLGSDLSTESGDIKQRPMARASASHSQLLISREAINPNLSISKDI